MEQQKNAQPPPYGQGYQQSYPINQQPGAQPYGQAHQPYGQVPAGQAPLGQTQVIVVSNQGQPGTPIQTYLAFSIFACLCCCWPIGLIAIIFSVRASDENGRANYEGAKEASRNAFRLSIAAVVCGTIGVVILIVLWTTGVFVATATDYSSNG